MKLHLVGSVPLPDATTVFRVLAARLGRWLERMPDGETGVRQSWIRFLQGKLAEHPAMEVATDVPPFRFVQWDGRLVREIPRLRIVDEEALDPDAFASGYAAMAIESWQVFDAMQSVGDIPEHIRFQIAMPSPIAPAYNNMVPADRPRLLKSLTDHFIAEVGRIAGALPHGRVALQWDVCQEVLAWEGYYEPGPVDFRDETLGVLERIGDAVPADIELGFHLCYGSPLDEHLVQPKDAAILVELANAISSRVERPIRFFHFPVPKARDDDAYFAPFADLAVDSGTDVYLGLLHDDDRDGDRRRLATAREFVRVDGVATECGMGRGDPTRLNALLDAHAALAEAAGGR